MTIGPIGTWMVAWSLYAMLAALDGISEYAHLKTVSFLANDSFYDACKVCNNDESFPIPCFLLTISACLNHSGCAILGKILGNTPFPNLFLYNLNVII